MESGWIKCRADKIFSHSWSHPAQSVKAKKPMRSSRFSTTTDFATSCSCQDWLGFGCGATSVDEVMCSSTGLDVASFRHEVARPTRENNQKKFPPRSSDDGATAQATPMQLIQAQVQTVPEKGMGCGFSISTRSWNAHRRSGKDLRRAGFFPCSTPHRGAPGCDVHPKPHAKT